MPVSTCWTFEGTETLIVAGAGGAVAASAAGAADIAIAKPSDAAPRTFNDVMESQSRVWLEFGQVEPDPGPGSDRQGRDTVTTSAGALLDLHLADADADRLATRGRRRADSARSLAQRERLRASAARCERN